ncbi:hypothetical protein AU198_15545 [Mycobacterium sp. GA-1199]|nr:hypothetical protein AU198_15545 [Mycobacterium sp. GA-1199]
MAVRAQQSEVVQRVVLVVAVFVIQFQRYRLSHPGVELAAGAPLLEDAFVDQALTQSMRLNWILIR